MSEEMRVYEIDINKKYVLSFLYPLSMAELAMVEKTITEWVQSDKPFLILANNTVGLVRIDEAAD